MSEADELYTGVDRGEFLISRLATADGVFTEVNARIKKVSVFNYGSQYAYALLGYQIEYWLKDEKAPYDGGTPRLYRPAGRPDYTTLYMRIKVSSTVKMLYLEDAIINDFITSKAQLNSLFLESYDEAAAQQITSMGIYRRVKATDVEYKNCFHTTRYESSTTAPLTLTEQWMSYVGRVYLTEGDEQVRYIRDKPFVSLKDMIDSLVADFTASIPT
jgi:hypothetical protein